MNRAFLGTGSDYAPPISRHKIFIASRISFRIGSVSNLAVQPKMLFSSWCANIKIRPPFNYRCAKRRSSRHSRNAPDGNRCEASINCSSLILTMRKPARSSMSRMQRAAVIHWSELLRTVFSRATFRGARKSFSIDYASKRYNGEIRQFYDPYSFLPTLSRSRMSISSGRARILRCIVKWAHTCARSGACPESRLQYGHPMRTGCP